MQWLIYLYLFQSGENFALEKPTEQSTTHGSRSASEAVDGDKNNHWLSCTHTAQHKQNPWWRVDLEQRIAVTHVKIVNRNNIGKRLCGFEIRIGDNLKNNGTTSKRCGSQQHIPSNQVNTARNFFFSKSRPEEKMHFFFTMYASK